jgi:hypothetical protein
MPTKWGNKTMQGKSHKNHKYIPRKATIQREIKKKKKIKSKRERTPITYKPGTKNGRGIGSSLQWGHKKKKKNPSGGW